MLNVSEGTKPTREYDAMGFEFEPLGVIRLRRWRVREEQQADGSWKVVGYTATDVPVMITDELRVNPETLAIVGADDPAGVAAFSYVRDVMFGGVKGAVEGFVQTNDLLNRGGAANGGGSGQ